MKRKKLMCGKGSWEDITHFLLSCYKPVLSKHTHPPIPPLPDPPCPPLPQLQDYSGLRRIVASWTCFKWKEAVAVIWQKGWITLN